MRKELDCIKRWLIYNATLFADLVNLNEEAMATPIQTYSYFYGAGTKPNREIQFFRGDSGKPESIYAVVKGLRNGVWNDISKLDQSQIDFEMMSTSDKIKGLFEARKQGTSFEFLRNKYFFELPTEEQDRVLHLLDPEGPYRIEITNGYGEDPRFEKVVKLTIFNPS